MIYIILRYFIFNKVFYKKNNMTTQTKNKQTTQTAVYRALRKSILTLNLLPGTVISENEISQKYEVSRTPVRETFIQLEKESLLKIVPQKGTTVSLIDFARVEQEYFLRKSLEKSVIDSFIEKADDMVYLKMNQYIELQKKYMEAKDYIQFMEYDDLFHKTIFETAGQSLCWEITENFSGHYYRIRMLSIWQNGIADSIIDQHREILNALQNKDYEASKKSMGKHLLKLDTEKQMLLTQFPQYFAKKEDKKEFAVDFGGLKF